jgi:hypothetical protein
VSVHVSAKYARNRITRTLYCKYHKFVQFRDDSGQSTSAIEEHRALA